MSEKIMQIVGKNPSGVERVLGEMQSSDTIRLGGKGPNKDQRCLKGYYGDGRYEVVFIDGTADWITIKNVDSITTDEFIKAWDLEAIRPAFVSPSLEPRFSNIYGIKELTVNKKLDGSVFFIYIKAFTD